MIQMTYCIFNQILKVTGSNVYCKNDNLRKVQRQLLPASDTLHYLHYIEPFW